MWRGEVMGSTKKDKRFLYEENEEVIEQQNYFVAKSNDLITHSRYSLTLSQQRLLLFLISKIRPNDSIENNFTVNIKDIINVCEYNKETGTYYKQIKKDILALRKSAVWIEKEDEEITLGWLIYSKLIQPKRGTKEYQKVIFRFDWGLEPYLFQLRSFYTQYSLDNVITLNHKYSVRLYEHLMTYANIMFVIVPVDELKARLDAQNYEKYNHFKNRVIVPAVDEISMKTNIYVMFDELKTGKSITSIAFYIWGIHPDSKDYTIDDMRITAGTKANIDRRLTRKRKRQIDKEKIIKANVEITEQTSMFDDN